MMRIGHGYDVHRLVRGRRLILGGVDIPHETGLLGHSDADVLTHAVMDALLGAAAMGDIGQLFPDKDPAFAGADSLALLCEVVARLHAEGYTVGNIDCTVLAQAPKLAPHIAQMRRNLAQCMDVDVDRISIKATTEEGLGFTGAREGFASFVSLLIPNTCAPKLFVSIPFAPSVSAGYAKHPQWKSGPAISFTSFGNQEPFRYIAAVPSASSVF